jgi:hypothetical protein
MQIPTNRWGGWILRYGWATLVAVALLGWTGAATAQTRTVNSSFGASQGGSFSGGSFSGGGFSGGGFSGGGFSGSGFSGGGFSGGGFSGGSFSGSSFSGGFSGGSFSGGSFSGGSFSGGSFSGGSFSGATGGGFTGTGGSARGVPGSFSGSTSYQGISPSNPFGNYYANPMVAGTAGASTRSTFGQPLFNLTTTTGTGTFTSNPAGNPGLTGSTANQSGTAFSPASGVRRAFPFPTGMGSTAPTGPYPIRPGVSRLQIEVQGLIGRSSALPSRNGIQVGVDGQTVILEGTVSDESERRLAEGLVRLTPGVHAIRNNLVVRSLMPPASGP